VVVDDNDDDDDVPEVVQPATRNDAMAKDPPSRVTNGKPAPRAKGRGMVGSQINGHKSNAELVIIDELDDDDPPSFKPLQSANKGKATENGAYSRELEKLRLERDLVRLSNLSIHFSPGYSRSARSTKKRANSYPKASFSSYRQEKRSQRKCSYP
jgi:hypothetical protein